MESRLRLRNRAADVDRLTEFASNFCGQHGLPDAEQSRLLVILDELFTNVLSHGYPENAEGEVEIALSLEADWLSLEFVDDAGPFDPLASPPPDLDLPVEQRPIGGIGITIVRALVDEISYCREADRNRLTMRRRIGRPV